MKAYLILICASIIQASLHAGVSLEVRADGESLFVYLINSTDKPSLVNRRFAVNAGEVLNELQFMVTDSHGTRYPFSLKVTVLPASEDELLSLQPKEFVGRVFRFAELTRMYSLPSGEYQLQALYKNRTNFYKPVFNDQLLSNTVDFAIP